MHRVQCIPCLLIPWTWTADLEVQLGRNIFKLIDGKQADTRLNKFGGRFTSIGDSEGQLISKF